MTPFYGWDWTALRLQCHLEEAVYLLFTTKFPEISDVHLKDESILEPPINHLGNQRLNH